MDDQKSGPFKFWYHKHHFREIGGSVEMRDVINYVAPFGLLQRFAKRAIENGRVKEIFEVM